jgi:5'-nucleotidase
MRKASAFAACTAALVITVACVFGASAQEAGAPIEATILAINDFHGHLIPPPGGVRIIDPADRAHTVAVPAGGVEHLAALVKELRAGRKNTVFVAAGDLVGASPLLSSLFSDEPTIDSLSLMGLDIAAVGNHEFDRGRDELLRLQYGGCRRDGGCRGPHPFVGAKFHYLAANVVDRTTGGTVFPPYEVREFDGIPVAFIGLTLKDTPAIVTPAGTAGLEFRDEAETVNALVPELRARGVEAIVVLVHEGGIPTGGYNECPVISGDIVDIVKKLDKAVDVVVSGHTHRAYNCVIDGRLVTSAGMYGMMLTRIDLKLDPRTRDVVAATADNRIVRADGPSDPEQTALIAPYAERAKPLAERRAGFIAADLTRQPNRAGESVLGDIIADAQLAATSRKVDGGATIAFTNPGGIRIDVLKSGDGAVTFADLFACQPFRNVLVTLTLTGAQIRRALEQQWSDPTDPNILQVSQGFTYRWNGTRPGGARVPAETIMLDGKPVAPDGKYRVTVNGFLATGGDRFPVFREGTERTIGMLDVDALDSYFGAHSPISPGAPNRIERLD